jgi:hypothetical protein
LKKAVMSGVAIIVTDPAKAPAPTFAVGAQLVGFVAGSAVEVFNASDGAAILFSPH